MNTFLKNYGQSLLLLTGIGIGGVCGIVFKENAHAVAPVGEFFLNILFTLVVPLVFFSVGDSICKLHKQGQAGSVLGKLFLTFLGMSLAASILAYLFIVAINPFEGFDSSFTLSGEQNGRFEKIPFSQALVQAFSVSDFSELFSKSKLLPLIIFAIIFGFATARTDSSKVAAFLEQGSAVFMKMISFVMYIAPVCLGCYFADMVASLGGQLLTGYLKAFVIDLVLALILFFVVHSLYVLLFAGKDGLKAYWSGILPPSITAFATCSSAVAIPGNIQAAKKAGVTPAVAEAAVPLGTAIHKDGSAVAGVLKIAFVLAIFSQDIVGIGNAAQIIGIALFSAIVMGAVTGGAATGELLICTMLGVDPQMAGVIIVLGLIVDMPSTLINSSANVVSAIVADSLNKRGKKHRI